MKKIILSILFFAICMSIGTRGLFAADTPVVTNNKVGIHILFPSEISQAASLVNTNGGDWGYVTIPIQVADMNLVKWQQFMDDAKRLHVIPIVRLAIENYYFNTTVWRKPTYADVLDYANFLNSLSWPTKNRYIIVFNEVNRGDEWQGQPNPTEYAQILSYAVTAFKTRNPNFFIISAGLDNASINAADAMNEFTFLTQMNQAVPGIFNQIDGMASHSYPNPGFASPPTVNAPESIDGFSYEENFIAGLSNKKLPVFITETGWSRDRLPDITIAQYFTTAFTAVWNNPDVMAVTPFLLEAGGGPFEQFSLLNTDGSQNAIYKAIAALPKIKGTPPVEPSVLAASTFRPNETLPKKNYKKALSNIPEISVSPNVKSFLKFLLGY
ncbi:MAG: hypothetical protein ACREGI_02050 [Candidatus Levyibacteriota bacterium]